MSNQPTQNDPRAGGTDSAQTSPDADPRTIHRRRFLSRLSIGLGLASGASILWAVAGFVIAPIFRAAPRVWRSVGRIDDFPVGSTTIVKLEDASTLPWAGYAGRTAAWLRRESRDKFVCFSVNCTHLGCPVRWEQGAELFMCPCHGGVYYKDGTVGAGPPPAPLPRYEVRLRNGNVEVLASPIPITLGV